MKKVRLVKPLLGKGTVFHEAAEASCTAYGPMYSVSVEFGDDYYEEIFISAETVENNPEFFEVLPTKAGQ